MIILLAIFNIYLYNLRYVHLIFSLLGRLVGRFFFLYLFGLRYSRTPFLPFKPKHTVSFSALLPCFYLAHSLYTYLAFSRIHSTKIQVIVTT